MTYADVKEIFYERESEFRNEYLTAHIVLTEDSFPSRHSVPLLSRIFRVRSNNSAYQPMSADYTIFGIRLDGTARPVELASRLAEEYGGWGGWKVACCYILDYMRDVYAIPNRLRRLQDDGTVSYVFGRTDIRVQEIRRDGVIHLSPVEGLQVECGGWYTLTPDLVSGYCTLLERAVNVPVEDSRPIN